jgi:hypothetical protein
MASTSKPIRKDVALAIERAWPDGVVDMPIDSDESYFWDIYPKVKQDLSRIKGATLLFERGPIRNFIGTKGATPTRIRPTGIRARDRITYSSSAL